MESWQSEIEKALETMEIFLALITDDFRDSLWTNQEVGFAKARHIPIISLKLGRDPEGFIADKQALKGEVDHPERSARALFKLLADKLKQRDRLQSVIVTAFCEAQDWIDARGRFEELNKSVEKLSDNEVEQIRAAYAANPQLHKAIYLHNDNRLVHFLQRTTGKDFELKDGTIKLRDLEEEIPF
jgi:hypothetical protein